MRLHPHPFSTWIALGLLAVVLAISTAGTVAWQSAWQQATANRLIRVTDLMAEAISLRWGQAPSTDQLRLAQPQLETALRSTPGLLGLGIITHAQGQTNLVIRAGQFPHQPPERPEIGSASILTRNGAQQWLVSASIGSSKGSDGSYLLMLADPAFFRPEDTPFLIGVVILSLASVFLIVGWWLLHSLDPPANHLLGKVKAHADASLISGGILLAALTVAVTILAQARQNRTANFLDTIAPTEHRIIEAVVNISRVGTESIAAFFLASDEVSADEFDSFIHHLLYLPGVEAWGWLTPVSDNTLAAQVNRIRRRDQVADFKPWRLTSNPAPDSPASPGSGLMVEFVFPRDENQNLLGFLFQSEPTRAALAARALERRAPTATTLHRLAHRPGGPPRLALIHPAFKLDNRLVGCAAAVISPGEILQTSWGGDPRMVIDWFEARPDGQLLWLAGTVPHPSLSPASPPPDAFIRPFFAYGNTYLLSTRPGPAFSPPEGPISALALVLGGLAFASTVWWIASSEVRFRRQLQQTVQQRTAELQATHARYADLARRNRTFVWETDSTGLYQYLDPVVEEVLGYRPEELVGKVYLWELHPEDGREEVRQDVFRYFREKLPVTNYENRAIAKNGRVIWLSSSGGPLLDEHGNFIGYRGWDTDITREKKRDLIAARTQRLESLGILSGGIAHDLNNALGPILISADLLRLEESDPDKKKLIHTILDSTQRAAAMVRQVLLFARGSPGQKVPLDPRHLIVDIASLVRDTFPKSVSLKLDAPERSFPPILGDPTQLHQVLLNLCINARDAMPQGGTLRLGLAVEEPAPPNRLPEVRFTVADTGQGMTPEVQARAFDPFFTTKEVGRGTGLGLSTSHTIIRDHGGRILLESEPGAGTCFTICLPALAEENHPPSPPASSHLPQGSGETILVVDDDDRLRSTTCQFLSQFGYSPLPAVNGLEAVNLLRTSSTTVHAALIDLHMPEMNGPATIRALRQIAPHLPIIATSGAGSRPEIEHASGSSIQGFLPKPYRSDDLLSLLRSILDPANSPDKKTPPGESFPTT